MWPKRDMVNIHHIINIDIFNRNHHDFAMSSHFLKVVSVFLEMISLCFFFHVFFCFLFLNFLILPCLFFLFF